MGFELSISSHRFVEDFRKYKGLEQREHALIVHRVHPGFVRAV